MDPVSFIKELAVDFQLIQEKSDLSTDLQTQRVESVALRCLGGLCAVIAGVLLFSAVLNPPSFGLLIVGLFFVVIANDSLIYGNSKRSEFLRDIPGKDVISKVKNAGKTVVNHAADALDYQRDEARHLKGTLLFGRVYNKAKELAKKV